MQQDLSALFSQSLGASSNSENKNCATVVENCLYFYCSDHDLCLFFNEVLDKPRCQWFDPHKISKKTVLHGRHAKFRDCSCQTRVSRQTCIKIESCDICLWRITFARQRSTIVDVSSYWFVLLCLKLKYSLSVMYIELLFQLSFLILVSMDIIRLSLPLSISRNPVVKISASNRVLWSFGRGETQWMAISIILNQSWCTQIHLC